MDGRNKVVEMIDVLVMYPNRDGMTFDEDYYLYHHTPLVTRLLGGYGLVFVRMAKGIDRDSPFFLVVHIGFQTKEAFKEAIDEVGDEIFEDIPRFTNVEPLIQVGYLIGNGGAP